ncbi:MAG: helix-turn-helix transcriptional regulator [Solirubrobacterales bacterium]|nr:helix-turn-helix transcriptional regulator [Solirubrobacterales bacterium]
MSIALRFGKNLLRARKSLGVSQEELAVRASLHRTEIGLLERGERLARIDTAIKLAGALGVPLDDLIHGIAWTPGYARAGRFEATVGARGEGSAKGQDTAQVSSAT